MSFGYSDNDDVFVKGDDGTVSGVKIGVEGDRLKMNTTLTKSANNLDCADNKLIFEWSDTEIAIAASGSPRTSIYSYSGTGKFCGFTIKFNSRRTVSALVIDGVEILNISSNSLNTLGSNHLIAGSIQYTTEAITFTPPVPICFDTSISLEASADSNVTSRSVLSYWITVIKES
jgi:hypothetical protein